MDFLDRSFWLVFLSIAIIGTITWLAIFQRNHHRRNDGLNEELSMFEMRES